MEINLTADEREMLYNLQTMRWSSFQGKTLSKIDGEYQKMVADDLKQMIECFDSSNDECMEFSRQQLHINITLLDVLIFSLFETTLKQKKRRRISRKKNRQWKSQKRCVRR